MISLEKLGIIIGIIVTIIALITYIWFTIRYKNVLDSHISSPLIYIYDLCVNVNACICLYI